MSCQPARGRAPGWLGKDERTQPAERFPPPVSELGGHCSRAIGGGAAPGPNPLPFVCQVRHSVLARIPLTISVSSVVGAAPHRIRNVRLRASGGDPRRCLAERRWVLASYSWGYSQENVPLDSTLLDRPSCGGNATTENPTVNDRACARSRAVHALAGSHRFMVARVSRLHAFTGGW